MSEAKSGCRAKTIGTSLCEYTFTLAVICRPNTKDVPGDTWAQQHGEVSRLLAEAICQFIERGNFEHIDGRLLAEDITAQVRELRLHADTERCEHGD